MRCAMRAGLAWCCLLLVGMARAQGGVAVELDAEEKPAASGPSVTRAEYVAQTERMQALVASCGQHAERCDEKAVPADESVDGGRVRVRWDWMRAAMKSAGDAKNGQRTELLQKASARLEEDAASVSSAAASPGLPAGASAKAKDVLRRPEFRKVEQNSYLSRKVAAAIAVLDRLFEGVGAWIPRSPWISVVLEWGLLGAAGTALVVWAWRTSRQQRMLMTVAREPAAFSQAEADDWAARAEAEAKRGEWREAVHCLYWSAIVLLEGERLWRRNRARTPREYVLLLEPGSPRRTALGRLTRVFERIWYGIRPATAGDYERAAAMLAELKAG